MTLRSTFEDICDTLHEKEKQLKETQKQYQQKYDENLLLYNMKKKPVPRAVRVFLIITLVLLLILYVKWYFFGWWVV